MRVSFITTIFNEENTIIEFLDSVFNQSRMPDEIIITDGGSRDNTVSRIKNYELRIKNKSVKFKLIIKKGNRSVGRNEAIRQASGEVIVCSDSGNILDKDWVKNIIKPFSDKRTHVAAGYYKAKSESIFQKCLTPYVLVMPDQVKENEFLPATRSIAFLKSIWEKAGGFNEKLSHNEDYAFALKLKSISAKIVFCKNAIVNWIPRKNLKEAFVMFFRFALGDIESGIIRNKVILLFARYIIGVYLVFLALFYKSIFASAIVSVFLLLYIIWAGAKNYRYVKDKKGLILLPLIQLTADIAVLTGSISGFIKRVIKYNYLNYFKNNKFLFVLIVIYFLTLLGSIRYGIPNYDRPFPFHMDEWHQLQAVANTYRYGTPNVFGSANGTLFHFLYSGIMMAPFWISGYINPFELQIDNGIMRERVFEVLRLQTIMFGMLSIFVFYEMLRTLKLQKKTGIFLFAVDPVWIILSGYFKYDIALMFWILLSFLFLILFALKKSDKHLYIGTFFAAVAFAVKVSAIPLVLIIATAYFIFAHKRLKNIRVLFISGAIYLVTILLLGMPDALFGKGNIVHYFLENVVTGPVSSSNLMLGMNPILYVFVKNHILVFGLGVWALFIFSITYWLVKLSKIGAKDFYISNKLIVFIFISYMIFAASLVPLQAYAVGNRSLVLLPFMVLIIVFALNEVRSVRNISVIVFPLVVFAFLVQICQSYVLFAVKINPATQEIASKWIIENISQNSLIGIENIPIYQGLPDIAQKEFYFKEYRLRKNYNYNYLVLNGKLEYNPEFIILTNDNVISNLMTTSAQKDLLKDMKQNNYKKIYSTDTELEKYFFGFFDDRDLYFSGLMVQPMRISIYAK